MGMKVSRNGRGRWRDGFRTPPELERPEPQKQTLKVFAELKRKGTCLGLKDPIQSTYTCAFLP